MAYRNSDKPSRYPINMVTTLRYPAETMDVLEKEAEEEEEEARGYNIIPTRRPPPKKTESELMKRESMGIVLEKMEDPKVTASPDQAVIPTSDQVIKALAAHMDKYVRERFRLYGKQCRWRWESNKIYYCGIEAFHIRREPNTWKVTPVISVGTFSVTREYHYLWHAACLRSRDLEGLKDSKAFKEELLANEFFPAKEDLTHGKSKDEATLEDILVKMLGEQDVVDDNPESIKNNNASFTLDNLFSKEDQSDPMVADLKVFIENHIIARTHGRNSKRLDKIGSTIFVKFAVESNI